MLPTIQYWFDKNERNQSSTIEKILLRKLFFYVVADTFFHSFNPFLEDIGVEIRGPDFGSNFQ